MKITKNTLKQLIKEELGEVMAEYEYERAAERLASDVAGVTGSRPEKMSINPAKELASVATLANNAVKALGTGEDPGGIAGQRALDVIDAALTKLQKVKQQLTARAKGSAATIERRPARDTGQRLRDI